MLLCISEGTPAIPQKTNLRVQKMSPPRADMGASVKETHQSLIAVRDNHREGNAEHVGITRRITVVQFNPPVVVVALPNHHENM